MAIICQVRCGGQGLGSHGCVIWSSGRVISFFVALSIGLSASLATVLDTYVAESHLAKGATRVGQPAVPFATGVACEVQVSLRDTGSIRRLGPPVNWRAIFGGASGTRLDARRNLSRSQVDIRVGCGHRQSGSGRRHGLPPCRKMRDKGGATGVVATLRTSPLKATSGLNGAPAKSGRILCDTEDADCWVGILRLRLIFALGAKINPRSG
jgi:hypothetical protein